MTLPDVAAKSPHLALVLWSGNVGGAESFTAALARAFRETGVDARVVFVADPAPLAERLRAGEIPFETLGLNRGRAVLYHPRRFARVTTRAGADGAILIEGGYLAATLRAGGYGGKIVAVEHGACLQVPGMRWNERVVRALDRLSEGRAVDDRVAVSNYVSSSLGHVPSGVITIPNAVDLRVYLPPAAIKTPSRELVVGCMARLVPGKGVDDVLLGLRKLLTREALLRIAGDGPERPGLESLATRLGIARRVRFLGWVNDASRFWRSCDVAIVPTNQFVESFGLTAVEAMACGRPVIATRNGGLPEIVEHCVTGFLVDPGDTDGIAKATETYLGDRDLVVAHGNAARARSEQRFDIRRCADAYLALFDQVKPA
jgi:glycosyltransferase involved in cell wall biosynthesis